MRLHHAIDHLDNDIPNDFADLFYVDNKGREFIKQSLINISGDVVHFDFGDVTRIPDDEWKDLQDYGLDLMEINKFSLPYPVCWFSYSADTIERSAILCVQNNMVVIICFGLFPFVKTLSYVHYVNLDVAASAKRRLFATIYKTAVCPRAAADRQDQHNELVAEQVRNLVALNCLLNARGVELHKEPAPEKLNKQRAARGKTLIGDSYTVRINVRGAQYTAAGDATAADRSSPRMHWRRGHIRRLTSGKILNVRPCLVGSAGKAPTATPNYAVGGF